MHSKVPTEVDPQVFLRILYAFKLSTNLSLHSVSCTFEIRRVRRQIGREAPDSVGSFPGLGINTTEASFHSLGNLFWKSSSLRVSRNNFWFSSQSILTASVEILFGPGVFPRFLVFIAFSSSASGRGGGCTARLHSGHFRVEGGWREKLSLHFLCLLGLNLC